MDLHFLSDLTATPGPYATVYVDASHDSEDAAHAADLRWSGLRNELTVAALLRYPLVSNG